MCTGIRVRLLECYSCCKIRLNCRSWKEVIRELSCDRGWVRQFLSQAACSGGGLEGRVSPWNVTMQTALWVPHLLSTTIETSEKKEDMHINNISLFLCGRVAFTFFFFLKENIRKTSQTSCLFRKQRTRVQGARMAEKKGKSEGKMPVSQHKLCDLSPNLHYK